MLNLTAKVAETIWEQVALDRQACFSPTCPPPTSAMRQTVRDWLMLRSPRGAIFLSCVQAMEDRSWLMWTALITKR